MRCFGPRLVPWLVGLVALVLLALPVVLVATAKAAQRERLWEEIDREITAAFRLKERLKEGYAKVGGVKRLPHAAQVLRTYDEEFRRLHNRTYDARKAQPPPPLGRLLALRRAWEEYHRRVRGHWERLRRLVGLVDLAETAVVRARFYQGVLRVVQTYAPYRGNEELLPQLAEADRQLQTAMSWVLTGIERYPEDLKALETPILLKAGVRRVREVTAEVDRLLRRLHKTATVEVKEPGLAGMTLAAYLERARAESRKSELPPLTERSP